MSANALLDLVIEKSKAGPVLIFCADYMLEAFTDAGINTRHFDAATDASSLRSLDERQKNSLHEVLVVTDP